MRRQLSASVVVALITLGRAVPPSRRAAGVRLRHGNAIFEVIGPVLIPPLLQTTAPNDAPHILRLVVVIDNAWFDAIAPYHPTAVGVTPAWVGGRRARASRTGRETSLSSMRPIGSSTA